MGNSPRTFEDPQFVVQDLLNRNNYSLKKTNFSHPLRDDYIVRFNFGSKPIVAELRMEFQDRQHISRIILFYRDGQQDRAMPIYRLVGGICDKYLVPLICEQGNIPAEKLREIPTIPKEESSLEQKVSIPDVFPDARELSKKYQPEGSESIIE